jgi:L-lactate dehydrogenase complex protein LldE
MRVALFVTCFNDTLFPQVGIAATDLLERLGHTVVFPEAQTCCGQLHYNTGYQQEALTLVRHFVEVFGASAVEAIVAPSASCAGMVRDLYPRAAAQAGDARLVAQVEALVPRVYELGEFLVKRLGVVDVGAYFPHRVTYHATCHSLRVLRVGEIPMQLLRAVKGIELVELPRVTECCGFGGTFAIKNADVSTAMLGDKASDVLETGAEVLCAADTSCLMHIGGGLHRLRAGVRTMHLAEILASVEGE